jgi:HAD superfamily phosphatase (TIGR01668 family)
MVHLLLKTKRFIPNEFYNSFFEIDFNELYNQGYRLILSDLDNTLISYDEVFPTEKILNKFKEIKEIGFELVLISNNVPQRINDFVKDIDIPGIANARKPLLFGINQAFKLSKQTDKQKIVIIGDQLMTDIWAANRFKAYSILVNPLKKKTEKWYTKLNRKTEYKLLQKIKKNYPETWKKLNLDMRK